MKQYIKSTRKRGIQNLSTRDRYVDGVDVVVLVIVGDGEIQTCLLPGHEYQHIRWNVSSREMTFVPLHDDIEIVLAAVIPSRTVGPVKVGY